MNSTPNSSSYSLNKVGPWFFCNEKYTPMAQVLISFSYGVLISPWSSGLFFLWVWFIIYELLYYIFTHGNPKYWQLQTRAAVICASFLGFVMGRAAANEQILTEGVPDVTKLDDYIP